LSLRAERSNLVFYNEIATHPSGARNDVQTKGLVALSFWDNKQRMIKNSRN